MAPNPDWLTALDAVAAESSFSGLIGIDRPGRPPVDRAIGLADRRWQVPVRPDSILAIASGTKGFTALTVMSLVTDGTLSLDATARSLLGADLPHVADDVTIRHLLGHRSGIGDYLDESELDVADYVLPEPGHRYLDAEDYLPSLDGHPTVFPADERFAYNNGAFVLAAILAERAAGVPYHQLVHDRVIAPAGMVDTTFQRSDAPQPRTATGYLEADGLRTNVLHMPLRGVGDGGLFSTLADMRSFWAALLAGRIVPPRRPRRDDRAPQRVTGRRPPIRPRVLAAGRRRRDPARGLRRGHLVPLDVPAIDGRGRDGDLQLDRRHLADRPLPARGRHRRLTRDRAPDVARFRRACAPG